MCFVEVTLTTYRITGSFLLGLRFSSVFARELPPQITNVIGGAYTAQPKPFFLTRIVLNWFISRTVLSVNLIDAWNWSVMSVNQLRSNGLTFKTINQKANCRCRSVIWSSNFIESPVAIFIPNICRRMVSDTGLEIKFHARPCYFQNFQDFLGVTSFE